MASVMREFLDSSYLFGANAPFIEELYEQYLVHPGSVPEEWRDYFDRLQQVRARAPRTSRTRRSSNPSCIAQRGASSRVAMVPDTYPRAQAGAACCSWSPPTALPARAGPRSTR